MIRVKRNRCVGSTYGIHCKTVRSSLFVRFARAVDKLVTRVQEWLEKPDGQFEKTIAYIILSIILVVILTSVIRRSI